MKMRSVFVLTAFAFAGCGHGGSDAPIERMTSAPQLNAPGPSTLAVVSGLQEVGMPSITPPPQGSGDCMPADANALFGLPSGYRAMILALPSASQVERRILAVFDGKNEVALYSDLKVGDDGYLVTLTSLPRVSLRSQVTARRRTYNPADPMSLLTAEVLGNPTSISENVRQRCGG